MFHQTRNISGWEVPTVAFGSPARDPIVLLVLGEIINEFTSNAVRKPGVPVPGILGVTTPSPWHSGSTPASTAAPTGAWMWRTS